jgi:hypothetical protein
LDRWAVAAQLVGHRDPWLARIERHQAAQERLGRLLVVPLLHQDVEDHAVRIHRPPQPVGSAIHGNAHLVQMPFPFGLRPTTAQFGGDGGAELAAPAPDRLVGDEHTPLEHQLFHAAIVEGEAEVEAHAVGDDGGRITVLAVG